MLARHFSHITVYEFQLLGGRIKKDKDDREKQREGGGGRMKE